MWTSLSWNETITAVSLGLAVISLLLSLFSQWSSIKFVRLFRRETENKIEYLNELTEASKGTLSRLEKLETQLATRSIGQFPDSIDAICTCLEQAVEDIVIVTRSIGYGASTAPEKYHRYAQVLRNKSLSGVKVTLIHPSRALMKDTRALQFDHGNNWEQLSQETDFSDRIKKLERRVSFEKPIQTYDEFLSALDIEDQRAEAELAPFVDFFPIDELPSLQCWCSDDSVAVFSIATVISKGASTAFLTRDVGIISSLKDAGRLLSSFEADDAN